MNLDDLRAELDARANDVDTQARGRMAGIRAKAAARRRRRAGATLTAAVVAVGVVAGVPMVNRLSDGPQPAGQPDGHEAAVVFPPELDGNTKVASEIGDQGEKTVTLAYTPDDTDLLVAVDCEDIAEFNRDNATSYALRVDLKADPSSDLMGGFSSNDYCRSGKAGTAEPYLIGAGASPDEARARWRKVGLRPGDRMTVEVAFWDGTKLVREPFDGRIGVALYGMPGGDETDRDDKGSPDTAGEPQDGARREPGDQADDEQSGPAEPYEEHDVRPDDKPLGHIHRQDKESAPLDEKRRPGQQGPVIEHKVPSDEQAKPQDYDERSELDGRGAMPVDPSPRMPAPRRSGGKLFSGFSVR